MTLKSFVFVVILLGIFVSVSVSAAPDFNNSISFFLQSGNSPTVRSVSTLGEIAKTCDPKGKFSVLIHQWRASCKADWMVDLITNLTVSRGGCIICMDYSNFSRNPNYFGLVNQFDSIVNVLVLKLKQLKTEGFLPENGYIYGFGYGAHLAVNGAIKAYGTRSLGLIDVCAPAGPGFDWTPRLLKNFSLAAKNVQCIFTSNDIGTYSRTCDQNWNMGVCSWYQVAAGPFPKGSHGLCPYFYNSAFNNSFPAVKKANYCPNTARTLKVWPTNYRMGYNETKTPEVNGTLHANTFLKYPYNK